MQEGDYLVTIGLLDPFAPIARTMWRFLLQRISTGHQQASDERWGERWDDQRGYNLPF